MPPNPYSQYPVGQQPQFQVGLMPHRGALILVLGFLGLVLCQVCGPFAWIMGNKDLKEMREGRMDRTGEGSTIAGKICGIIGTCLLVFGMCTGLVYVVSAIIIGAAVAVGASGRP